MSTPFPRVLHQTWKDESVPEHWRTSPEAWRRLHPGWEHRLWTDADLRELIETHYAWFLPTYDGFKYNIQRVDAARTFVLHHEGGVYSDLDVEPTRSLEPYVAFVEAQEQEGAAVFDCWLAETPNSHFLSRYPLSNHIMGSRPGARLWERYWRYMVSEEWQRALPWWMRALMRQRHYHVLMTTGPTALSAVWRRLLEEEPGQGARVAVLPKQMAENRRPFAPGDNMAQVRELEGESWCDKSSGSARKALWAWDHRDYFWVPAVAVLAVGGAAALAYRRRHRRGKK